MEGDDEVDFIVLRFIFELLSVMKFCQIAPGVNFIMNGAIIAANSTAGSDISSYIDEINELIPLFSDSDLGKVKEALKQRV